MDETFSLEMIPALFGSVLECLKSDTWSNASLDGVETQQPVKVSSAAPVESGLDPDPPR